MISELLWTAMNKSELTPQNLIKGKAVYFSASEDEDPAVFLKPRIRERARLKSMMNTEPQTEQI